MGARRRCRHPIALRLAAAASLAPWGTVALAAPEQARPADQMVDSIGINVHASFYGTPYGNWDNVISAINDLGIRYVRDDPRDIARLNQLTAATGAKIDLIMQDRETIPGTIDIEKLPSVIARAKQLTGLAFMEGPNEPPAHQNWVELIHAWQPALYQQVKADPQLASKPLIMPSFGSFDYPQVLDLAQYADGGNLHHYPPFAGPATTYLDARLTALRGYIGPDKPVYITEGGWHNATNYVSDSWPGVSETAAAKYYPAYYTEAFNRGFTKTLTYELIEEIDDPTHTEREVFGLLRADWTPKPAYHAVKNFIALLSDPGADFSPAPLDYSITGGNSSLHHTLLQKRDGSYDLALWQDASLYDPNAKTDLTVPSVPITLDFQGLLAHAETYLPTTSADPSGLYAGPVSQLSLSVSDQMLIVHITPVAQRNWNVDADGSWGGSANWQNGVPVGTAVTARFANAVTGPRTVTLDTSRMVGNVVFDSAHSYTIAGTAALTIDGGAGAGSISVLSGNHTIAAPLSLATSTTLAVSPGLTLTLGNNVSAGASNLTITGGGRVELSSGGDKIMKVAALSITGAGSKLDLQDNRLISTAPGAAGSLTALIADGKVVTTSAAGGLTTLGVATAAQVEGIAPTDTATWAGQTVSGSDALVMYTYGGDANLDGKINVDDYGRIDFNVALGTNGWFNGDFNYDGKINVDDYGIIDFNIGIQGPPLAATAPAAGLPAVPEPASLLLTSGFFLIRARSRRKVPALRRSRCLP